MWYKSLKINVSPAMWDTLRSVLCKQNKNRKGIDLLDVSYFIFPGEKNGKNQTLTLAMDTVHYTLYSNFNFIFRDGESILVAN